MYNIPTISLSFFSKSTPLDIFVLVLLYWLAQIKVYAFSLPLYRQFHFTNTFLNSIEKSYNNLNIYFERLTGEFKGSVLSQRTRLQWLCELISNYFVNYFINQFEIKWFKKKNITFCVHDLNVHEMYFLTFLFRSLQLFF